MSEVYEAHVSKDTSLRLVLEANFDGEFPAEEVISFLRAVGKNFPVGTPERNEGQFMVHLESDHLWVEAP